MSDRAVQKTPIRAILASNEEDRFTEYLSGLLTDSAVLSAFLQLIPGFKVVPEEFRLLSVDVQVAVEGGRPDLVISGPNTLVLCEAKVGSWIHGNQLVQYAKHLRAWKRHNAEGAVMLLLLAPASQLPTLLGQAKSDVGNTPLRGLAWEDLATFAREMALKTGQDRLRIYLEDFAELVHYRLGELGRPFTTEELQVLGDQQYAIALTRVYGLTSDIVSDLEESLGKDLKSKKSNGAGWSGFNLTYRGSPYWLGVWLHVWSSIGGLPLCLQIKHHIPNDVNWPKHLPPPMTGRWKGSVLTLTLLPGIERDEQASFVAQQVAAVLTLLNPDVT